MVIKKITEPAFVIFIIAILQSCAPMNYSVQYKEKPKTQKSDKILTLDSKTNKLRPAHPEEIDIIEIEPPPNFNNKSLEIKSVTLVVAIPTSKGCIRVMHRPPKYVVKKDGAPAIKRWTVRAPKKQRLIIFLMFGENGFYTHNGPVRIWKNNKRVKAWIEGPIKRLEFGWFYLRDGKKRPEFRCNGYSSKGDYSPPKK